MKKLLSIILIISFLSLNLSFTKAYNPDEYTYFVVTAYYSPLPDQSVFYRGNYELETRLNGQGIAGASGMGVFPGMIAAPSKYSFGTKIELEGIGIGSVQDRGGAIVAHDSHDSRGYSYDRIDIWVGHGEEGLRRALAWGKRTVKGRVLSDGNTPTSINIDNFIKANQITLSNRQIVKFDDNNTRIVENNGVDNYQKEKDEDPLMKVFDNNIGPESNSKRIKELQELLGEMGYYYGEISGKYEDIKEILIDYQLRNGIIANRKNLGAGYFGPKTRLFSKDDYISIQEQREALVKQQEKIEKQIQELRKIISNRVNNHINSIGNPRLTHIGSNVRTLQKTLKSMGYFDTNDTAYFGPITEKSLISYQLDKGIIESFEDSGAGIFGPQTREKMKEDLIYALEKRVFEEKNLLAYIR